MPVYSAKVRDIILNARSFGRCADESASGVSANLECGSSMRFSLCVDPVSKKIENCTFTSNACGFAFAAGEIVARAIRGVRMTDLHGSSELKSIISSKLGETPANRAHCIEVAIQSLREALANYRLAVLEEFQGEKALICTCFGVSEDTVIKIIEVESEIDVDGIASLCNAGSGCGSCQLLIQHMIDNYRDQTAIGLML